MANNRLVLNTSEFLAALRKMPNELRGEASHLVEATANSAAVTIRGIYGEHRNTGNLQDHVVVEHADPDQFSAGAVVKSTARHAWLFDNGSLARHWVSGKSTGKMWGKTPPTHAFVKTMIRARRRMYEQLAVMLERAGFQVSRDA